MKKTKAVAAAKNGNGRRAALAGPSLYEVEFLRQLKEELEIFLRSKNFSTIRQFDLAFAGRDYVGRMQVHA